MFIDVFAESAFLFYHSDRTRLLIAMDASLSVMALKPEVKNRITSHEQPVTCARFLDQNQVIFGKDNSSSARKKNHAIKNIFVCEKNFQ